MITAFFLTLQGLVGFAENYIHDKVYIKGREMANIFAKLILFHLSIAKNKISNTFLRQ